MTYSIYTLRQTAKEILAAAVLEVFPGTQLIGGEVSDIGFHYDFLFESSTLQKIGERELARIEDQMRLIAFEKRPISASEMMRENAQNFFCHLGHPYRAEVVGEIPTNIVSMFKMGNFHDACLSPYPSDSSVLTAFKLFETEVLEGIIRISGTAFFEKDALKNYLKKFKEAKKSDYRELGPRLELFYPEDSGWIYLPKGEALRKSLIDQWRELHIQAGFHFLHADGKEDLRQLHQWAYKQESPALPYRLAQMIEGRCDFASIFCKEESLLSEMISSLQFIDQTIKIFGFERRVYLLSSSKEKVKNFLLIKEAIAQSGISLSEQELPMEEMPVEARIEFRLFDGYGRGWEGPYVTLDPEKPIVYRSLFGSIDRWIALLVEQSNLHRDKGKN